MLTLPSQVRIHRGTAEAVLSWIIGLLVFLHLFLAQQPSAFNPPLDNLDGSWQAVINYAMQQHWQWGKGIAFNYGPLGFVRTRLFDESLLFQALTLRLLLASGIAWSISRLLLFLPPLRLLAVHAVIVLGIYLGRVESIFIVLPLLLSLSYLYLPASASTLNLIPLTVAIGLAGVIKLTYGMVGCIILSIVDFHRLTTYRWPLYTPLMLAVFFITYLLSGQSLTHFPDFLELSRHIISGHSAAMASVGSWRELTAFIVLSGLALSALAGFIGQSKKSGAGLDYRSIFVLFSTIGIFWLINFKQGFVRHDLHSLEAWGGLATAAALVAATVFRQARRLFFWGILVIALLGAALGIWRWQLEGGPSMNAAVQLALYAIPSQEGRHLQSFICDPQRWVKNLVQQREAVLAQIRDRHALPSLSGSVDVIPSMQIAILAQGYDYRPRPVFQEYLAYTPQLIAANQAFLLSDHAPDYLFFRPGSIDDRYPASAEGALWPDILSRYQPERLIRADLLLLARRPAPLQELLADSSSVQNIHFGQSIPLTHPAAALFVKIKIKSTLFGRLADWFFKPSSVWLTVRLRNGAEKTHRLIPQMASEGFLLSPYIDNNADFIQLATGNIYALADKQVETIAITTASNADSFFYNSMISLELRSLQTQRLFASSGRP